MPVSPPEPFVKWAGGKRLLADQILAELPRPHDSRYFEPFLGGGAVFFRLGPGRAILSDFNEDLVDAFKAVREDVEKVISALRGLTYGEDEYYRIRAARPRSLAEKAARFIYLNKTCFNGLYRVNLDGQFNVPFGRHPKALVICDEDQLRSASRALQVAVLRHGDFGKFLRLAREGDVAYLDPPYTTAHSNNGFIEYNARIFSWADQARLARHAHILTGRGVRLLISNADHPSIRALYSDTSRFRVIQIRRPSTVAGKAAHRKAATELLIAGRN
jgi:DNA adenine methylase